MNPHVLDDAVDGAAGSAGPPTSQARDEGRWDKMRLRMPRVNQVQSDDGSAVLIYEGLDTSHDLGGGKYVLRIGQADQATEVRARVSESSTEARKHATSEGIDYSALSLMETINYLEMIADKYGRRSQVILFELADGTSPDIEILARQFCSLFFEMHSSYKYNHPEYPESGEGYYPDEIYFCPLDVDKKLYMTICAGEPSNG